MYPILDTDDLDASSVGELHEVISSFGENSSLLSPAFGLSTLLLLLLLALLGVLVANDAVLLPLLPRLIGLVRSGAFLPEDRREEEEGLPGRFVSSLFDLSSSESFEDPLRGRFPLSRFFLDDLVSF